MEARVRAGYSAQEYERPELKWTQSSFIQPQMMVEDRYFYDPVAGHYTVDKYLDDLEKRYGGIDSVLIWPVYPNIGIDNRNQYDMVRAMPGGVAGVKQMVADFHRRGVKVFFPIHGLGSGHTRRRRCRLGCDRETDDGNRSGRRQRRHAAWNSARLSNGVRRRRASAGTRT